MKHLPRKSIFSKDGISKKKRVFKLSSKVRSILNRCYNKWSIASAHQRIALDLSLYEKFMGIMLSLFKGDLIRICEQSSSIDSKCNLKAVMMFASMIEDWFTDDHLLTGKFVIMFFIIDSLFFPCV